MGKEIKEFTSSELGYLKHTLSVECSYHEFKDAKSTENRQFKQIIE